jgi:uncharacterized protein (TIGR02145 family)
MKKSFLFLTMLWLSLSAFSQVPQAFKYQAVARDLTGNPVINQEISVKISILAGSPEGDVVYSETHQTTTNSLGLLNLEVGRGITVTGEFAMIAWGNNASFIKTEMDITGGSNFVFMGISQLLSVPYSLFSDNGVPDGQNPGDMLYWNGTQWIKVSAGQNGQVLTFNDGVPVWGGVQLPIINTNAITNINAFTAYGGGNIASDGGSPVIARGLCWNNAPNPTIANFKTTNGSGAGSFNANLNALAASTLYYVRAYATNSAGTSYGNEVSFTTANGSASLSTTAVTAITTNSATSGGNITNNGGAAITVRGVCWNTLPYPTIGNSKTTNGPGNGVFVSELTSLAPNTLYYVRAYATNSLGTSYGQQLNFTTQNGIVTLTTAEVTEITATTAISGGEITNDGGSPVTARGVCWSTAQNPTIADSTTNDGNGNGVFVSNLTGLLADTSYYVRSYATNGVGTYYGNEVGFMTLSGIISLTTTEVFEITTGSAICGGEITYDGGSPVSARGICWSTSPNPTIADSTTIDGSGNGIFTHSLTSLSPSTNYYVKAYATNEIGTYYGDEISFTTLYLFVNCGDIVSYNGKNYHTVKIYDQCWFKENLDIGTMIPGNIEQTNNGVLEKYCYNNDPANCEVYGGLYQWDEMMKYGNGGNQGICKEGWRVPSQGDICDIIGVLGGYVSCNASGWTDTGAGAFMKESGTIHWFSPNYANNSSGYTALPGGGKNENSFWGMGSNGYFWTQATDIISTNAWAMYFANWTMNAGKGPIDKSTGLSIRCIKNN